MVPRTTGINGLKASLVIGCSKEVSFEAALEAIKRWGCGDVVREFVIRRWAEDGESPGPIGFCGVFGDYEGGLGGGAQLSRGL